jgi:hypothetical protein
MLLGKRRGRKLGQEEEQIHYGNELPSNIAKLVSPALGEQEKQERRTALPLLIQHYFQNFVRKKLLFARVV